MARVLVVGSVAYDTVETPAGKEEDLLGGSAVYFSLAARLFSTVAVSGVVGEDFAEEDRELLRSASVEVDCLETVPGGRTFRWHGRYHEDMNRRDTVSVALNVLEDFRPVLPERHLRTPFVFLANGATATQLAVLEQVAPYRPVVYFDTMNLWIETEREGVLELLRRTDGVVLNDGEARVLTGRGNLLAACRALREMGAGDVVVKKGEHGLLALLGDAGLVALPAFPLEEVKDPTGAGDAFAGAFMATLARAGGRGKRRALAAAVVTASFCVETFGAGGLLALDAGAFERRLAQYRELCRTA